jgi:hypothetical protein
MYEAHLLAARIGWLPARVGVTAMMFMRSGLLVDRNRGFFGFDAMLVSGAMA